MSAPRMYEPFPLHAAAALSDLQVRAAAFDCRS
jgi:hypothetical protein